LQPGTTFLVSRKRKAELPIAPVESAKAAGLRYVTDLLPGYTRRKRGSSFRYYDPDGKPVHDKALVARFKKLAIPPAYNDVWICPLENGHLQATGRDARGRKQYRYHARWREVRDETKYERMVAFAQALPHIRGRVEEDLTKPGLPREKVLATVVKLLESTLIRVGNEEYAKDNGSFGLTTMRSRHVDVSGPQLRFSFRGKSGKEHRIGIRDKRLASIVKRCLDLPGQLLFQYIDDEGERQNVGSADVNEYVRDISGDNFTAKDFRTWIGTVYCAHALHDADQPASAAQIKKNIADALQTVAQHLGNTPNICRKCYVHPIVLEAYTEGTLTRWLPRVDARAKVIGARALSTIEEAVVRLLNRRLKEAA
jgi:DNA topoisomerase-1